MSGGGCNVSPFFQDSRWLTCHTRLVKYSLIQVCRTNGYPVAQCEGRERRDSSRADISANTRTSQCTDALRVHKADSGRCFSPAEKWPCGEFHSLVYNNSLCHVPCQILLLPDTPQPIDPLHHHEIEQHSSVVGIAFPGVVRFLMCPLVVRFAKSLFPRIMPLRIKLPSGPLTLCLMLRPAEVSAVDIKSGKYFFREKLRRRTICCT